MKFTHTAPTVEGMYWCYIDDGTKPSFETGTVRKCNGGYLRVVRGAFDHDWGSWLYWGDPIEVPSTVEFE